MKKVWVAIAMLVLASVATAAEEKFPADDAPESFVALRFTPSTVQPAHAGAYGVELRELRPKTAKELGELAPVTPKGFTWRFTRGFGQLVQDDEPELTVRAFAVGVPDLVLPGLRARLRAASPRLFREQDLGTKLETMGIAIVGLSTQRLDALFPVPFGDKAPSIGLELGFRASKTSFPESVTLTTPYKIDGIGVALLREILKAGIVPHDKAEDALATVLPYSKLTKTGLKFCTDFISRDAPAGVFEATLKSWLGTQPRLDVLKIPLWLGSVTASVPPATRRTLTVDLVNVAGTLPEEDATPAQAMPDIGVDLIATTRERGEIDFEGFAVPAPSPDDGKVRVRLSLLAIASYPWARASLARQLLRGWRWRAIVKPGESAKAYAQTLLRFNEPIWDLICASTISTQFAGGTFTPAPQDGEDKLDAVDVQFLDEQAAKAAARAASPELSFKLSTKRHFGYRGENRDSYFAPDTLLQHRLCAAMKLALDDPRSLGRRFVDRIHEILVKPVKAQPARRELALSLADIVADGYSLDARALPTVATTATSIVADMFPGQTSAVTIPSLEPDLLWLARAVDRPANLGPIESADGPLARLFREFGGTRLAASLTELTTAVKAVEWRSASSASPATPPSFALHKEWLIYFERFQASGEDPVPVPTPPSTSGSPPIPPIPLPVFTEIKRDANVLKLWTHLLSTFNGAKPQPGWVSRPPELYVKLPPTKEQRDFARLLEQEYDRGKRLKDFLAEKQKLVRRRSKDEFFTEPYVFKWKDPARRELGMVAARTRPTSLEMSLLEYHVAEASAAAETAATLSKNQSDSVLASVRATTTQDYWEKRVLPFFTPAPDVVRATWRLYLVGNNPSDFTVKPGTASGGSAGGTLASGILPTRITLEELKERLTAIAGLTPEGHGASLSVAFKPK